MQTGHESGFGICREISSGKDYFSPVVEGLASEVPHDAYDEWGEKQFPYWSTTGEDIYDFISLHFHPEYDEALDISRADFRGVFDEVGPRIVAVGCVNPRGVGYTLLFQWTSHRKTIHPRRSEVLVELAFDHYNAVLHRWEEPDFARVIEIPGTLRADRLNFYIRPESQFASLKNPKVLARFGHSYTVNTPGQ